MKQIIICFSNQDDELFDSTQGFALKVSRACDQGPNKVHLTQQMQQALSQSIYLYLLAPLQTRNTEIFALCKVQNHFI